MPVKAFDSSQGEGYSLWSRKVSASEVVETHKVFDTSEHQWDRKAHSDYEYTVCICIYIYVQICRDIHIILYYYCLLHNIIELYYY